MNSSSTQPEKRPSGMPRRIPVQPRVGLRQRRIGVRPYVELEVVGVSDALRPLREHRLDRLRSIRGMQQKRWHALDGDVDQHAECAEPEHRRRKQLGVLGSADREYLSRGGHQGHRSQLGREAAERATGSVGSG